MTTFNPDNSNQLFQLATDLVNRSNRNIFLTGKAGTGKTTFLKYIRENCPKQMAVVAPTGVAAINAAGVTMHSFFQLPLSMFIPEASGFGQNGEVINKHGLISRLRMNGDKKRLLQELELLIIDEVSMVRCDTLDAVDTILRHVRQRPDDLFGGVQLLFIGDLFQLAPVMKGDEWQILSEYYDSRYFFSSHALREQSPLYIEFDKIYRQSDEQFIGLLNQIRNNQLNGQGKEVLESRFNAAFHPPKEAGYIILTTHNSKADAVNNNELQQLPNKSVSFTAAVEGEFPEKSYPADQNLILKKDARVMFIKNDAEKVKRYYNGKIGTITGFTDDGILVQCGQDEDQIEVKKEKWENIRYSVDKKTRAVETDVAGSFTQFPLRLAWAITIHKSQGLTFSKAIIDAGDAFEAGQVYVALSRCTSLDGLVLKSRIQNSSLYNDRRIIEFSDRHNKPAELAQELAIATENYKQEILLQLFDFKSMVAIGKEMVDYLYENGKSFNEHTEIWTQDLQIKFIAQQEVAGRFQQQLLQLFHSAAASEKLQQRVNAATTHFCNEIDSLVDRIQKTPVVTDSRMHAKEFNDWLRELFSQLSLKRYLLNGCSGDIDINAFHLAKKKFVTPSFPVNVYAASSTTATTDLAHPFLYQQLRKLRDSICSQRDLPVFIVAASNTLNEMVTYLPQSLTELKQISGFGDAKIEKYGHQFLDIIQRYCNERDLPSQIHLKSSKKERKEKKPANGKPDTKSESFRLYKTGLSVEEIMNERKLTASTIEEHLAYFVEQGELDAMQFVSEDVLALIEPVLKEKGIKALSPIKQQLGDSISYRQIRFAVAWYRHKNGLDN